jgi:hypothetical protein
MGQKRKSAGKFLSQERQRWVAGGGGPDRDRFEPDSSADRAQRRQTSAGSPVLTLSTGMKKKLR